jgi:sugar diacid utilization regulator
LRLDTGPLCVLAAAVRTGDGSAAAVALTRRLADGLELYLASVHPSAVVVPGNDTVFALVGSSAGSGREALESGRSLARDFVHRGPADQYLIGVGGPVEPAGAVSDARVQAEAALRALRHEDGRSVATLAEVALPVLLLHLADVTASVGLPVVTGPLRTLAEHDGADGVLTRTLAAYFASACVADGAALALRIHVNTLRYRLRRIREISGLDFADADTTLLAQLQLRLRDLGRDLGPGDKTRHGSSL